MENDKHNHFMLEWVTTLTNVRIAIVSGENAAITRYLNIVMLL